MANDDKTKRLIVLEEVMQSRRSPEEKREAALISDLQKDMIFIGAVQDATDAADARAGTELDTADLLNDPDFEADLERAYNAAMQRQAEQSP